MKKYTTWADVPDHLKTRTQLNRMGLRPAAGQKPTAIKVSGYNRYALYEVDQAVAKRKVTTAQLAALKEARQQAALNSRCAQCGMPFKHDKGRRYKITTDTGNGAYICFICHDRQEASQWAQQFLADPNALILDTETTGLDETAQIVKVAIINTSEEVLLNTLVKPTIEISGGARAVHGITDRDLAEAVCWPEVDENVFDLLRRASQVAIYNAEFDQQLEGGGHRALDDCLATLAYIKRMADESR